LRLITLSVRHDCVIAGDDFLIEETSAVCLQDSGVLTAGEELTEEVEYRVVNMKETIQARARTGAACSCC